MTQTDESVPTWIVAVAVGSLGLSFGFTGGVVASDFDGIPRCGAGLTEGVYEVYLGPLDDEGFSMVWGELGRNGWENRSSDWNYGQGGTVRAECGQ